MEINFCIFSGVQTLRGLPEDLFLKAELVCLKFSVHNDMVFLLDIPPCRLTSNNGYVAMIESPFLELDSIT